MRLLIAVVVLCSATMLYSEEVKHLFMLTGQSNMERLNPNQSFTPAVVEIFGKDKVIVVHDAQGGQPIRRWYRDWKPEGGEAPKGNGDLYDQLMIAADVPHSAWINTDDLNDGIVVKGKKINNDLHYSPEGFTIFGKRLAEAAIKLIEEK